MITAKKRQLLCWGLLLAGVSVAPVPRGGEDPKQQALAETRVAAAIKQFNLIWQYYQQSRVQSFDVYYWSRLLLDANRGVSENRDKQIAAYQEHLDRMKRLEVLIVKIRRIGFGRSSDVGASEYYRVEAECWLAEAKARR